MGGMRDAVAAAGDASYVDSSPELADIRRHHESLLRVSERAHDRMRRSQPREIRNHRGIARRLPAPRVGMGPLCEVQLPHTCPDADLLDAFAGRFQSVPLRITDDLPPLGALVVIGDRTRSTVRSRSTNSVALACRARATGRSAWDTELRPRPVQVRRMPPGRPLQSTSAPQDRK
jgi:hypothetical protein